MYVGRQLRDDLLSEDLDEIQTVLRRQHDRIEQIADAQLRLQDVGGNAKLERRVALRQGEGDECGCKRVEAGHGLRRYVDDVVFAVYRFAGAQRPFDRPRMRKSAAPFLPGGMFAVLTLADFGAM